jgi:putative ABC transport system permease protein
MIKGFGEMLPLQFVWVLGLGAIAVALSAWQRLGLAGSLALAIGRSLLQLAVLGYALTAVYELKSPWVVLAFVGVMLVGVTLLTRNRISQRVPNLLLWVGGSLLSTTALTLIYATVLVFQPDIWYSPQLLIPLAGVILANGMNGAAIAGERLVSSLNANPTEIETHLSLGASPQIAIASYRRDAIKAGISPTLNTMMIIGLVTLPNFMAGQLLSGTQPLVAAIYQGAILILLLFSTLVAILLITHGITRQYFNAAQQLILW